MNTLPAPDPPPQANPTSDDRRLWFDYIKTLNERSLQAAQRSGATTYVLLAVFAALVFKFTPRLPQFLSDGQNLRIGAILLMFELDVVIYLAVTQILLFMYAEDASPSRLASESTKRHTVILYTALETVIAAMIALHVAVLVKCDLLSRFVRITTYVVLVWSLLNFMVPFIKEGKLIWKARTHKVPIPRFQSDPFPSGWPRLIGAAVYLVMLALVASALTTYCGKLGDHWVRPAKAAALLLVCLTILAYTFFRGVKMVARAQYLDLERDILLLQLDAPTIKTRFERELIGLDIAHWLDELVEQLNRSNSALLQEASSFRQRFESIKQIDAGYADAQNLRYLQLLNDINKGFEAYQKAYREFDFKLDIFLGGYKNARDVEVISGWTAKYHKAKSLTRETLEVMTRLTSEMKEHFQNPKPE